MARRKGNGHRTLGMYRAYNFREKDPELDRLRTLLEDDFGHKLTHRDLKAIEDDGGPSIGCMRAWWWGETKRPTNPALEAAGRSRGFGRVWQKLKK